MLHALSINCTGQFDLSVLHEGVGPMASIGRVSDGRSFGRRIGTIEAAESLLGSLSIKESEKVLP
jgi:hypothetical protein